MKTFNRSGLLIDATEQQNPTPTAGAPHIRVPRPKPRRDDEFDHMPLSKARQEARLNWENYQRTLADLTRIRKGLAELQRLLSNCEFPH